MGINEYDHVNFSQDHELDYHLKKVNKRQTENNRMILKEMGEELKKKLNKSHLTHTEFHNYIETQLNRLE
ncbi:hypothetical protein [Yersinia alsatica]|uniref:hypothetical protein n=1 Tax=Yersinia alsatica TaxID=2890317 RepID=UPI0011A1AD86|nr:hypothetical protein [Yersinia alsatica]